MNSIIKSVLRLPAMRLLSATSVSVKNPLVTKEFARTLFSTSGRLPNDQKTVLGTLHTPGMNCMCGCNAKFVHTKGERELVEFLAEEITSERKAGKAKKMPTDVEGFQVKTNGAEVEMTKQNDKERIVISFNVNHTVDADDEAEVDPNMEKENFAEMKSSPQFEVDIVRDGKTMSFTCSFLHEQSEEEGYNDIFGIDEVTIFDGEWTDKSYAVAGDVLDGYLYDLLMNLLEEKGISNDFVEKLAELSTTYEHNLYVNFLETVSKFTVGAK